MRSDVPQFLVRQEPRYAGWWGALAAILSPAGKTASGVYARFARNLVESRAHLPRRALFLSASLHLLVVLLLIRFSAFFASGTPRPARIERPEPIYYELRVDLSKALAAVRPRGPGGRPGKGSQPDKLPARGSDAFHASLTIVSNPPRPNNTRQTIMQPASPPDLRITQELRLPAVLIGNPLAVPKPRLKIRLQAPRAVVRQESPAELQAPAVSSVPSDLPVTLVPEIKQPHLPVPPMSSLATARVSKAGNAAGAAGGGENEAGETGGVLVIGVNSADMAKLMALPPGNGSGVFTISPSGGHPGSPGGVPGGVVGGGSGGAGTGGDGSTGIGSGGSGGGGGGSGVNSALSISGATGAGASLGPAGKLPSVGLGSMVFPVPAPPRMRGNKLIIYTGPVGGGGLRVYGALHGGKIYTIFLPMPGRSWTLEYCVLAKPSSEPDAERSKSAVVRLGLGVVPPDVEERFDFKRRPVPEDKADKLIVLYGVIREDGTVDELKIYQGVEPEMDKAAVLAFGRWKFRPALQEGKAVAVEILVGIPVRLPKS